jgi:hypothetical protein
VRPLKDNTICRFPFQQLALKEWTKNGMLNATPCCNMIRPENPDPMNLKAKLKISKPTAKEIFHGKEMSNLRAAMLAGERHSACNTCWAMEDRGAESYRLAQKSEIRNELFTNPQLQIIDFSFGENCNLRCRICMPGLSNKLRLDYRYFLENAVDTSGIQDFDYALDHPVTQQINSEPDSEYAVNQFDLDNYQWQDILDNIDELVHIKATGGETTLSKGFLEFIDTAIDRKCAHNITLEFHSNCTKFTNILMQKLNKFKELKINASIDSIYKNYNYMRYPMTWDKLESSLHNYLNKVATPGQLSFNPVVTALNSHSIPVLYKYQRQLAAQYHKQVKIHWHLWVDLLWPENKYINIKFLPRYIKEDLIELYSEMLQNNMGVKVSCNINNIIAFLKQHLDLKITEKHRVNMLREITAFDRSRDQNFKDYLHPSIINFLEEPL